MQLIGRAHPHPSSNENASDMYWENEALGVGTLLLGVESSSESELRSKVFLGSRSSIRDIG